GDGADGDRLQVTTEQEEHEAAGDVPAASPSAGTDTPEVEEPAAPAPRFALFPPVEEQIERITEAQAEEKRTAAEVPAQVRLDGADRIPNAVIGRALTAGGNGKHSIERIVAHFQKDFPLADSAEFLRGEFGTGGKGVTIAGQKYSLWYDNDGIRIAAGNRALTPNSTSISWTDAALMISDLLHKDMYATQDKIDGARGNEFTELSEKLWYLHQDFSDEARAQNFLPSVAECWGHGFPEDTLQIAELIRKPESRAAIVSELQQFSDAFALDRNLLRFRPMTRPSDLTAMISAMDRPVTEFHAIEGFEPVRASFITEDEIDALLQRSASHIYDSKLRIFSYILQGHDAKECADFIRHSYGEGGYGYMGYDESHGGKGIKFRRGDEFSNFKDYDEVFLNWNQVQKRVRQLIDDGKYLNSKEQAHLHDFEMEQLARNVYAFQYYTDPTPQMDRPWDVDAGVKRILPILEDPARAKELYDQMFNTWMPLRSDFPHYDALRVPLRDMGFYVQGEYSLFKPLPEKVLQAERDLEAERKKAKREARQAGMVDDGDDEEAPDAEQSEQDVPTVDLRKAARALAQKQKQKANEEPSGQLNLFGEMITGEQASMFDTTPEPPAPPAPPAKKPAAVVDVILSPDLERERRSAEAARKQAVESLAREGITVPDKIMEYITFTLGRDANNVTRIEEMAREILNPTPDPEAAAKYKLGYGHMGNGLTVWNSLEEEHGDYKTVAHIDPDRSVKFYDAKMPESVRMRIVHIAATSDARISATQDAPVFSVPPMVREQKQEVQEAEHNSDAYRLLSRLRSDCEYYLGAGQRSEKHLWAGSVAAQISKMRELFAQLAEKPEWITAQDIDDYERRMTETPTQDIQPPNAEQEREAAQETDAEQTETAAPEQSGVYNTPKGISYRVGDFFDNHDAEGKAQVRFQLTGVDDDYIYYIFPDLPEQAPAKMFRDRFEDYLDRGTQDGFVNVTSEKQAASEKKRPGNSRVERNYRNFARQFPEIINGEYRYLELRGGEGSGYMPLIIQRIGENEIAVAHTYLQNGDVMNDPEMTFRIDREKGALEPLTFQQDGTIQLYQRVYPEPGKWIPKLRNDLSAFTEQWLKNIEEQGRDKYRAIAVRDGEDVEFSFDKDGNPVAEVDPFPSQQRRDALAESSPWWVDYLDAKAAHPDDVVLYQVGDFFEMYGEDAKEAAALLDLQLGTRPVAGVGRVAFCGVPVTGLEQYAEKLRDKYDLTISAVKIDGSGREVYEIPSIDHEAVRAIDAHEAEFGADGYRAFPGDAPEPDYNAVKEAHPDDLVLYQVGDKFELRGEDAKEAARLLKLISLESRQTVDYDKAVSIDFSIHADAEIEILRASRDLTICTVNEDGRREVRSLSRSHKAERESAPVSMDDPDRFSVRSLDEQGEMFGIWDAALGRFYVEGEKILIVSGRDA
ncbi:MAG: hypothetical protein IJV64_08765, partial [Oscillospiraceae bacterium]|nr:hypothetical protein [Oscillospiraceae bacterium]